MSITVAKIVRTEPNGITLLLDGSELLSGGSLVTSAGIPTVVFDTLLTHVKGNKEIRVIIDYTSSGSTLKQEDYITSYVVASGKVGVILDKLGIMLYDGALSAPTVPNAFKPFTDAGGGSDLPEVDSDDNGKVLSVVEGEWDKATPAKELPSVSGSDNGKVLTVYNGAWTKGYPTIGLNVERIEVQDWGNEYVLCKAWPDSGTYTNPNFDNVDSIYIYNGDNSISILGTFGYRYYYHSGQENRNSPVTKFFNPNSTYGIVLDADTAVMNITIENVSFTWSDDGYFSCSHN